MEGAHTGPVREELQPVRRTPFGEVCGELSPVEGTSRWSRGMSVRSPPPLRRKEWQRQSVMKRPQPPFPTPLYLSERGGSGNWE